MHIKIVRLDLKPTSPGLVILITSINEQLRQIDSYVRYASLPAFEKELCDVGYVLSNGDADW